MKFSLHELPNSVHVHSEIQGVIDHVTTDDRIDGRDVVLWINDGFVRFSLGVVRKIIVLPLVDVPGFSVTAMFNRRPIAGHAIPMLHSRSRLMLNIIGKKEPPGTIGLIGVLEFDEADFGTIARYLLEVV